MNNIPNVPEFPESSHGLEDQIPSVVAASQKKNNTMMAGFLLFMALVAILVCRKGKPKDSSSSPVKDSVTGPSLPPPMVYPRPPIAVEAILTRSGFQGSDNGSLLDMRRKSPMVIFNKTLAGGNGISVSDGAQGGGLSTSSGLGGIQTGAMAPGRASGAPMPSNFSPTTAVAAQATASGDRESTIMQGKLIDAVLETAINSDHPGMLRAIISHDVYGETGRIVLFPRGSRLIGQYDSAIAKGQNRVFVIWQRAIRPDGVDLQLGSAGTDTLGQTGIEGDVNNHFFTMFGAATLLSIIGASASTLSVNPQDQNNSLAQYRENVTNGFSSAAGTVLGQFVQIKPTITVRQGILIKVFVARDLYFDPALGANNLVQYIQ